MNPQYSLWQKIIVPFLIGVLFLGAYLIFKHNPEIMSPDPFYQKLVKNRENTDARAMKTNLAEHNWTAADPIRLEKLSHRLMPATESEFLSQVQFPAKDDVHTRLVHAQDHKLLLFNNSTAVTVQNLNGEKVWSFQLPDGHEFSKGPAATQGQTVWLSTTSGRVYALHLLTGEVLWYTAGVSHFFLSPIIAGDKLILFIEEKTNQLWDLQLVNSQTGEVISRHGHFELPFSGRPVIHGNNIYFATQTGHLVGLDMTEGKELWSSEGSSSFRSQLSAIGERLYIANEDGFLLSFDRKNGRKVSEIELGSTIFERIEPVEGSSYAITVDNAGYLLALDLRANKRLWKYNLNQSLKSHPFELQRISQQSLNLLNYNSEVRGWSVWVACSGSRLCMFDVKNGVLLHRMELHGRLAGGFAVWHEGGNINRTWVYAPIVKDDKSIVKAFASPAPKTEPGAETAAPAAAPPAPNDSAKTE